MSLISCPAFLDSGCAFRLPDPTLHAGARVALKHPQCPESQERRDAERKP